jgi:hypothetical protein
MREARPPTLGARAGAGMGEPGSAREIYQRRHRKARPVLAPSGWPDAVRSASAKTSVASVLGTFAATRGPRPPCFVGRGRGLGLPPARTPCWAHGLAHFSIGANPFPSTVQGRSARTGHSPRFVCGRQGPAPGVGGAAESYTLET